MKVISIDNESQGGEVQNMTSNDGNMLLHQLEYTIIQRQRHDSSWCPNKISSKSPSNW